MLELARTVRFCLDADGALAADAPRSNTFAAWPPMRGLGRYYELEVVCRGEAEPDTGYFMNIKRIDEAAREAALPLIAEAARRRAAPLAPLLRSIIEALNPRLRRAVASATLRPAPTYRITMETADMDRVLIAQQYEFSAAHRLHVEHLSEAENTALFGKCNNAAGHGHNYRLEVVVRAPLDDAGRITPVERLDDLVHARVVEKLDHKHLDKDVPRFERLNTSVENIARVIHGMLIEDVRRLGVELERVRVWETGKTACTYPA